MNELTYIYKSNFIKKKSPRRSTKKRSTKKSSSVKRSTKNHDEKVIIEHLNELDNEIDNILIEVIGSKGGTAKDYLKLNDNHRYSIPAYSLLKNYIKELKDNGLAKSEIIKYIKLTSTYPTAVINDLIKINLL